MRRPIEVVVLNCCVTDGSESKRSPDGLKDLLSLSATRLRLKTRHATGSRENPKQRATLLLGSCRPEQLMASVVVFLSAVMILDRRGNKNYSEVTTLTTSCHVCALVAFKWGESRATPSLPFGMMQVHEPCRFSASPVQPPAPKRSSDYEDRSPRRFPLHWREMADSRHPGCARLPMSARKATCSHLPDIGLF